MHLRLYSILAVIIMCAYTSYAAEVTVTDDWINSGETKTMTSDNVYILDGLVFVEDGAKLNIDAGTVIKGKPGQEHDASALIICKGAQIFAEGTEDNPIIFTAQDDDPNDMTDLPLTETGLWGGVIILGKAQTNNPAGTGQIEGINELEPRGEYGMAGDAYDNNDNSGVFRYVSIRHGGTDIGDGNEINGLTMGALGAGTTIDHVEVWYNADDGFEFFGGTVNTSYLVSAFNKDDSFDYDQGFNGKGQFWFSIQADNRGNCAGEHDGGDHPDDSEPYARPVIYNATYIGSGLESESIKSRGLHLRDNAGGKYYNTIIMDMTVKGLDVEDLESGHDSRERLESGDLVLNNILWWNIGGATTTVATIAPDVTGDDTYEQGFVRDYLSNTENNNWISDPMLRGIARIDETGLDPRPSPESPAFTNATTAIPVDGFFTDASYIGAFGSDFWIEGWTLLNASGIATPQEVAGEEIVVTDDWINAGETKNMTSNNTYILDGLVFVEDGATLNIQAGTVVKANPGQEHDASALIICKGAQIFAEGTAENPIIFTAKDDDPYDYTDLPLTETGLWGGVIILGKAQTNNPAGTGQIEGINELEPRGEYGMPGDTYDNNDNSGVMRYVSIRHGGTDIGDGNEINGLTMGAVGAGTTIDHVEVWYNADDGFEFFGGTVNTSYLVSAFNKDDSFDYDQGFNGYGQFWFSIQADNRGNCAGEHDGGDHPDDSEPYARPVIYNATYIGSGLESESIKSRGLHLRDNAGGKYYNTIIMDMTVKGLDIEDLESGHDSRERLETGDLVLNNILWWNIGGATTTLETIAPDVTGDDTYEQGFVRDYLSNTENNNWIEDPSLRGIARVDGTGLDPRPNPAGPAFSKERAALPDGSTFFTQAEYIGAFGNDLWIDGWTFLSASGIALEQETVEEEFVSSESDYILNSYPNPFENSTEISFFVENPGHVNISVYNILGEKVNVLIDKYLGKGLFNATWDADGEALSGMYFLRMETQGQVITRQIIRK